MRMLYVEIAGGTPSRMRVEDTLGHENTATAEDCFQESVIGEDRAINPELREAAKELDGLLGDACTAVGANEGGEHVLVTEDETLGHVVEKDAAGVVEHGSLSEDGNDLGVGLRIVAEAHFLHPPKEAEGTVGVAVAGAAEYCVDKWLLECRDKEADGVLEAGRPWPLEHHFADCLVERRRRLPMLTAEWTACGRIQ